MSNLKETLTANYGDDANRIEKQLRDEVHEAMENAQFSFDINEEIEDILSSYGLEPDYLIEVLT